jgi:hypothetical protein
VRSYLGKPFTKVGLVEWLKVKALSSNPSTEKKKKLHLMGSLGGDIERPGLNG